MIKQHNLISSDKQINRLPRPSPETLAASLAETAHDLHEFIEQAEHKSGTVLYLGYGSNLSNETFRGSRGIQPLSQVNVQCPFLRVTFDLPGLPYIEPCFANSGPRDPENDPPSHPSHSNNEKSPLLAEEGQDKYRKDRWHKGLIGVVYEVTAKDYAHIIATEGGGTSYQDIVVECHPFASDDPSDPVPQNPILPPFKAHTLFAPGLPPDADPPKEGGRNQRPDPSYAQASARYLKLMVDGAAELGLPYEYQDYLQSLRPYKITTFKQRVGLGIFVALWVPIVFSVFGLGKIFANKKGRLPGWLRKLTGAVFKAVWISYDKGFRPIFGDGERTMSDEDGDDHSGEQPGAHGHLTRSNSVISVSLAELEKFARSDN